MQNADLKARLDRAETAEEIAEICRIEIERAGGPFFKTRYCKDCGAEIEAGSPAWVMNREGCGIEYFHAGCDIPPGYAERCQ